MNAKYAISYALKPGASLHMDCSRDEPRAADIITALGWAGREPIVSGFDRLATNLIRSKWACDENVLPELHRDVKNFSVWHFGLKHWAVYDRERATAAETMDRFAAQVIIEYDNGVCHECHGRGTVPNASGVMITCTVCNGAAMGVISSRQRANALKISQPSIIETWGKRLDFIQREIAEVERQILRKVRMCLEDI